MCVHVCMNKAGEREEVTTDSSNILLCFTEHRDLAVASRQWF